MDRIYQSELNPPKPAAATLFRVNADSNNVSPKINFFHLNHGSWEIRETRSFAALSHLRYTYILRFEAVHAAS